MTDVTEVFDNLVRCQIELWDAVDARLRSQCGLPLSQLQPMQVVARTDLCRVLDIATELAITVGGVSKIVDRIEKSGYCRRQPHPADRRSSIIELTADGRRMVAAGAEIVAAELAGRLGAPLSARALTQLNTTLLTLRAAHQPSRPDLKRI